jgi:hypothetical protein
MVRITEKDYVMGFGSMILAQEQDLVPCHRPHSPGLVSGPEARRKIWLCPMGYNENLVMRYWPQCIINYALVIDKAELH